VEIRENTVFIVMYTVPDISDLSADGWYYYYYNTQTKQPYRPSTLAL
jgi:hypothetical protein